MQLTGFGLTLAALPSIPPRRLPAGRHIFPTNLPSNSCSTQNQKSPNFNPRHPPSSSCATRSIARRLRDNEACCVVHRFALFQTVTNLGWPAHLKSKWRKFKLEAKLLQSQMVGHVPPSFSGCVTARAIPASVLRHELECAAIRVSGPTMFIFR